MKVCFVAGTLGRAGAERQLVYMLRALLEAGIRAHVSCLGSGEAFESDIRALGVPVAWVGQSQSRLARARRIASVISCEAPDIVQSAHFYTNLYAAVAARLSGAPSIGAIRTDLASDIAANGRWGWAQLYAPQHTATNSALAWQRAIAHRISPQRITLIENAVDTDRFQPTDRQPQAGELKLLFVGRLTRAKRPDRFVRLVAHVQKLLAECRVKGLCVGAGPLLDDVRAVAGEMDLQGDQFEISDVQEDIEVIYAASDILVSTSDIEGTPNVILEALSCGLPVVATRAGGTPALLADGRGLLFDPNDEAGMAAGIAELAQDAARRAGLARQGRDYVAKHHTLAGLKKALLSMYSGLTRN